MRRIPKKVSGFRRKPNVVHSKSTGETHFYNELKIPVVSTFRGDELEYRLYSSLSA